MEQLGIPYTIYERRHEVGGVWSINKYPDARVDTASSTYEYNFEKNYPWTEYFARQTEVRGYIEHVAKKHGMWPNLQLQQRPERSALGRRALACGTSTFARPDGTTFETDANAVVSAVGVFANPKFVDFPGSEGLRRQDRPPDAVGRRRLRRHRQVGRRHRQRLDRRAAASPRSPARPSRSTSSSAPPQWISPRPKYGQPVEPEIRWLLDTMPGYWNWQRYTATSALFASHELMVADPEWQAKGGFVNEKNDALRDRSSPPTSSRRSVTATTSSRSSLPTTRR